MADEKTTTQTTETVDPWNAMILQDLGKVVKDGAVRDAPAKAPEGAAVSDLQTQSTLSEVARANAEKAAKPEAKAEDKKAEDAKTEKAAEATTEKKEAAATTETPAEKPKIEVEKRKPIEEIIEGVVNRLVPKPSEKTSEKPTEKKEDKPAVDPAVSNLDESQKEAYELAQFAAKRQPDKYGNFPDQLLSYYKKAEAEIDRRRAEDKDWDPESDEDFSAWIEENQPSYQSGDRRRLERDMIATQAKDEAKKELEAEFRPKIEETERISRAQSLRPEIEKSVQLYKESAVVALAQGEKSPFQEVVKTVTEGKMTPEAWSKAEEIDPLAASLAKTNIDTAGALAEEYMGLISQTQTQVPYRNDLPATHEHNVHAAKQFAIFSFLDRQEQIFMADPNPALKVKDGKTFVSRRQYTALPDTERGKHWTIGNDDVLDMLAVEYINRAKTAYSTELKRLERMGYARQVKTVETKKEESKTEKVQASTKTTESPKATTSSSPGTANGSAPTAQPSVMTEEELKRYWSGGASVMKV